MKPAARRGWVSDDERSEWGVLFVLVYLLIPGFSGSIPSRFSYHFQASVVPILSGLVTKRSELGVRRCPLALSLSTSVSGFVSVSVFLHLCLALSLFLFPSTSVLYLCLYLCLILFLCLCLCLVD